MGKRPNIMQHITRMLSIRFFIGLSPPVRIGSACPPVLRYHTCRLPLPVVWKRNKYPSIYQVQKNEKTLTPNIKFFRKKYNQKFDQNFSNFYQKLRAAQRQLSENINIQSGENTKGELSYKEIKSSPANSSRTSGVAKQNPNNSYPFLIFSADTKGSVNIPHPNEDAQ